MIQKLKSAILSLSALFMLAIPVMAAVPAYAAVSQTDINNALKCGSNVDININAEQSCDSSTPQGANFTEIVKKIINILSVLVGAIAVIMIIFGGFRYVTSAGNDTNVSSAKNTILYAVIGLIIVALAQIIVHFVLNNIITDSGSSGGGGSTTLPGQSSPGGRGGV
jgi:hypothetical protein